MNLGPFGFPRLNHLGRLGEQSLQWIERTTGEIEFFDAWAREYNRIKEQNRVRGKAQRDKLGKEGLSAVNKIAYARRRDKNIIFAREYREKLKSDPIKLAKHNAATKERKRWRRQNDLSYAVAVRIRTRIGMAFRYYRVAKRIKSIECLGCSAGEYKNYIESLWLPGMSWENYGRKGWHIDHRRPIASFDLNKQDDVKAAFHFTNTQPMWWLDNLSKGAKIA